MKKSILILFCMLLLSPVFSQNIEGSWYGALNVGPMKLRIVLNIKANGDGYSATMDSPDQGAKDIAITAIRYEQPKLTFHIQNLIEYEGLYANDSISGTFRQNGMAFSLVFSREVIKPTVAKRPQDPQPPYPYHSEDIRFENKEAGITLAGTFTWPEKGGNFPVAILVSGSGPQNRNEEILNHRPFLVLADYLTRNGIAVLRYDDRGVGESGGDYKAASLDDFTSDAKAAISYVKNRKETDSGKIGVIGHSEGGTIAFLLAGDTRNNLSYIVSMAGMSIRGDSLLKIQRYLLSSRQGVSDEDIAKNEELINAVNNVIARHPEEYILQNIERITDETLPDSLKKDEEIRKAFQKGIKQLMTPELKSLMACDPSEALTKIKCNVLALGGKKDLQVPADLNLDYLQSLVKSRVTIKKYPDLNHLFQHCTTGLPGEYAGIDETISPEVLHAIATWIIRNNK